MALELGELNAILKTDNSRLKVGLAQAEQDVRTTGDHMRRDATLAGGGIVTGWVSRLREITTGWSAHTRVVDAEIQHTKAQLQSFAVEYARTQDRALLQQASQLRSHLAALEHTAASLAAHGGGLASVVAGNVSTAFTNVSTNLINLIYFVTAFGTITMTVAVPAITAMVGALGALVPLLGGGAVVALTFVLGLRGLADAFKDTTKAGGGVVDRAYQIEVAERRLRDANREATAAQDDLTRARERASERMEDLTRSLARAQLDERSAAVAVKEARDALTRASVSGDRLQIERARIAYEQARQAVEETRDRVEDLTLEQQRNITAGVDGSDEVTQALERQQRAVESIRDAEHSLAQSRRQSGGGAAQEIAKLAPAAQELVDVIKGFGPLWEAWGLDTQQRLMAGWAHEVKGLAASWLPTLRQRVGGLADTFNGLFKLWSSSASKPEFIDGVNTGMLAVQRLIDRIGRSIAGPFMEAWGRLSRAAAPFIDQLGEELGTLVDEFSAWIKVVDENGKLEDFFKLSSSYLHDIFSIGKSVVSAIGDIIYIVTHLRTVLNEETGIDIRSDKDKEGGIAEKFERLSAWLKDPENQKKIAEFIQKIKDFVGWATTEAVPAIVGFVDKVQEWSDKIDTWSGRITAFKDNAKAAVDSVVSAFTGLPGRIGAATGGLFDGIPAAFRSALRQVVGWWNDLYFPGVTILGQSFGQMNTPNITVPGLKDGGMVRATPGGRLAVLAEGGEDEVAAPEGKMRQWIADAVSAARGVGGGTLRIILESTDGVRTVRREVRHDGGDSQVSLSMAGY